MLGTSKSTDGKYVNVSTKKMQITNIVSTAHLNTRLDLAKIAKENINIIYDPSKFGAASWRHRKIHGTLQIFPNGKLIHLGPPACKKPRVYIRQYARILQKQGYAVRLSPVRLVCMSAVYKLSGPIRLESIPHSSYHPEVINTAITRRAGNTYSIFHTGTVIIAGITNVTSVYPYLLELELLCE